MSNPISLLQFKSPPPDKSYQKRYDLSVNELIPTGMALISIQSGSDSGFSYQIVGGNMENIFRISAEGIIMIRTGKKLDYERTKSYHLQLSGISLSEPKRMKDVYINVEDANDHAPVFDQTRYIVAIPENYQAGKKVIQVSASDLDAGANGMISYYMTNTEAVPFDISLNGTISLEEKLDLDRVTHSVYYLYVKAFDWGLPVRQDTSVVVQVKIQPVNSHTPLTKQSNCRFTLTSKDIDQPHLFYRFEGADLDFGDVLSYQLLEESKVFHVNRSNGDMYIRKKFTPAEAGVYHLIVSDGIHTSKAANITISYGDEESLRCDKQPNFTKTKKQMILRRKLADPQELQLPTKKPQLSSLKFVTKLSGTLKLQEDVKPGTIIGSFHAAADDYMCLGTVIYFIKSGNEKFKFNIDLFNGSLYLESRLDREDIDSFLLEIVAQDLAGHEVSTKVDIQLQDVNDHAPVFSSNSYSVNIVDNTGVGKTVFTVSANDPDEGTNGEVRFTLLNHNKIFDIDEVTGVVTTKKVLSNYKTTSYNLEIKVFDLSIEKQRYSYANLEISIIKTRKLPPKCLTKSQSIRIPQHTPVGTIIGRIFGLIDSKRTDSELEYRILNHTLDFNNYFIVHDKSGIIQTKKKFSTSFLNKYFDVGIQLSDQNSWPRVTVCSVRISFINAKRVRPVFEQTSGSAFTIQVNDTIGKGVQIAHLKTIEQISTNSKIVYEIIDGSGIGSFNVGFESGRLVVARTGLSKSHYWLTVQARISSHPNLFTNLHVLIKVHHAKEAAPFFNPSVYYSNFAEDQPVGQSVLQVFARDPNKKYSIDHLKFDIYAGNGNDAFSIDQTGTLTSKKMLSASAHRSYRLNITVCNKMKPHLVSHGFVVVEVVSTGNNHAPSLLGEEFLSFYESGSNAPPYLFQVLASDADQGAAGQVEYSLLESENSDMFHINPTTGTVTTSHGLEAGHYFIFNVIATDKGLTRRASTKTYYASVISKPTATPDLAFKQKR